MTQDSKPIFNINLAAVLRFILRRIRRKKQIPVRNFGLIKDKPDGRDILYRVHLPGLAPSSTGLRAIRAYTQRYDQLALGSCTANAGLYAFRRVLQVNGQPDLDASRLFVYFNARSEDCKAEDSGASIRDMIKGLAKYGACKEETWPYLINKFAEQPTPEAFTEGEKHQVIKYERLPQTKEAIMDAVWRGYPVVYGKLLYESFMDEKVARTGVVPYPKTCIEQQMGGHAMVIFDYDPEYTYEPNSWGKDWGINGVCKVPWKYVLDKKLCFDFWAINITE